MTPIGIRDWSAEGEGRYRVHGSAYGQGFWADLRVTCNEAWKVEYLDGNFRGPKQELFAAALAAIGVAEWLAQEDQNVDR